MSISYEYYKIFYYVGKYKSFSKAAKILNNSQPNITRTMNNLETELGCKLFIRSNKGVALTSEGEKLFLHVQAAHEQLQMGEAEINSLKNLHNERISIGFSIGITEILLHGWGSTHRSIDRIPSRVPYPRSDRGGTKRSPLPFLSCIF